MNVSPSTEDFALFFLLSSLRIESWRVAGLQQQKGCAREERWCTGSFRSEPTPGEKGVA